MTNIDHERGGKRIVLETGNEFLCFRCTQYRVIVEIGDDNWSSRPKVISPGTRTISPKIYRRIARDPELCRPKSCSCVVIKKCADKWM